MVESSQGGVPTELESVREDLSHIKTAYKLHQGDVFQERSINSLRWRH